MRVAELQPRTECTQTSRPADPRWHLPHFIHSLQAHHPHQLGQLRIQLVPPTACRIARSHHLRNNGRKRGLKSPGLSRDNGKHGPVAQCCACRADESSCCQRADSQPCMPPYLPLGPPCAPASCSAGTTPGHAGCRGWCTAAAARSTRLAAAPPQPCRALGGGRSHREWATAPPASCARHNIVGGQSNCRCKGDGCCMHDPKTKYIYIYLIPRSWFGLPCCIKANRSPT